MLMWLRRVNGTRGVEVAVRFLGRGDVADNRFDFRLKRRIWLQLQIEGHTLDHLEDVGVVELDSLMRAAQFAGGLAEVVDATAFRALVQVGADGYAAVGFQAGAPEAVVDLHCAKGQRPVRIVSHLLCQVSPGVVQPRKLSSRSATAFSSR